MRRQHTLALLLIDNSAIFQIFCRDFNILLCADAEFPGYNLSV